MIYVAIKIIKYALFICRDKDKQAIGYVANMPQYTKIKYIERYDCPVNLIESRNSMRIEHIDKYLQQQPENFVEGYNPDGADIIATDELRNSRMDASEKNTL